MTSLPALPRILTLWLLLAVFSISSTAAGESDKPPPVVNSFLIPDPESPPDRGVILFINTSPFGARVTLDGEELAGRTPMVVEAPTTGKRVIQIRKAGFGDSEISFSVETGSVIVVEFILPQTGSNIFFQDGMMLGTDSKPLPPGGYSLNPGNYNLSKEDGLGIFTPVYPNQKWIDGLNIAIPIVTVFAGGMMISEALSPRTDGRISPFTISALAVDLLLVGANIGFHIHRSKWRKTWETDPAEATPFWADDDYQLAEATLESGEFLRARNLFDRYAMIYPLEERTPEALYRSARLAYIQGDISASSGRLKLLRKDYPVPGLWDRGWRLAADLYFRVNQMEEGLAALDMIYGLENPVDLESAAFRKASVLTESARETGDIKRAVDAWDLLITTWPESDLIDAYRESRESLERSY